MVARIPIGITFEVVDAETLQAALDALTTLNRAVRTRAARAGHPFAPLYEAGIRYQRETPRVGGAVEDWKTIDRLYASREGDCEDLACALASEIPGARAIPRRSSAGWHIVVRLPDGTIDDPSRRLGMR